MMKPGLKYQIPSDVSGIGLESNWEEVSSSTLFATTDVKPDHLVKPVFILSWIPRVPGRWVSSSGSLLSPVHHAKDGIQKFQTNGR